MPAIRDILRIILDGVRGLHLYPLSRDRSNGKMSCASQLVETNNQHSTDFLWIGHTPETGIANFCTSDPYQPHCKSSQQFER